MTAEFEQLRRQYQPKTIKVIFITEAVQPGKTFLYRELVGILEDLVERGNLLDN